MKGTLTTRLYGPDGRLLGKASQPSRSLTVGFMKILHVAMAQADWSGQRFEEGANLLRIASPAGGTLVTYRPGSYHTDRLEHTRFTGECFGIQVSMDDSPIGPYDYYLKGRIGHGGAYWRSIRQLAREAICTNRWDRWWEFRATTVNVRNMTGGFITSWSIASDTEDLTHDGTYLWSINSSLNLVRRHHPLTGDILQEWATPASHGRGIAWDWENQKIFTLDRFTELIYRHDPSDGSVEASGAVPAAGLGGRDGRMEWYEDHLWILYGEAGKWVIYKVDAATFALVDTIPIIPDLGDPRWGPRQPIGLAYGLGYWLLTCESWSATNLLLRGCHWGFYLPEHDMNFVYGGTEVYPPTFAGPNGEMSIRALFSNASGGTVTIRKTGIQAGSRPELIAADILSPPVDVGDGQVLEVLYTLQTTV